MLTTTVVYHYDDLNFETLYYILTSIWLPILPSEELIKSLEGGGSFIYLLGIKVERQTFYNKEIHENFMQGFWKAFQGILQRPDSDCMRKARACCQVSKTI